MTNLPAEINTVQERSLQYITFTVGEELFGVNIMCVEEIITPRAVTAIPRTPDYFLGIINLRGEVISIIDMRTRFGIPQRKNTSDSRVVVIHSNGLKLGMLVDKISSIVTLDGSASQASSRMTAKGRQKYISGSFKLSDESILLLLAQEQIVNEEDFQIHQEIHDSQELVTVEAQKKEKVKEINLVGFSLSGEQYTIESHSVEEIIVLPEITVIPEMEGFVEGIFHLRESVIPVIRLTEHMGLAGQEITEDNPVIIIKISGLKIGLIVDKITEVFLIGEDEVLPPPINLNQKQTEQLKGVIKLQRGEDNFIVMLLKLEKLFSPDEETMLRELGAGEEAEEFEGMEKEEEVAILEFSLAEERYAIPLVEANEIIPVREIVPVPKAPPFIRGVINLRGDVISIVDLPLLVGQQGYQFTEQTKILVVNPGNEVAGLIVEKMLGIRKVLLSSFDKPSDLLRQQGNIFIEGIGKVDETGEIVVLMDIATTLAQAQGEEEYNDLESVKSELEQLEFDDQRAQQLLPPSI